MDFVVSKRELVKALARVQNVADRRSSMPILTNVLVAAGGPGKLRVAATDLTLSVASTIDADIRKGGSVAMPAKHLFDAVKALPEGDVTVTVGANFTARVAGGRRRFDLVGMSGDEFPALPEHGKTELLALPVDALAELIGHTAFSMSTDDARPHLAGAMVERDGDLLRMVTTDGHRLSKAERRIENLPPGQLSMLVPAKGVLELRRLLDEVKSERKGDDAGVGTIAVGQVGSNVFFQREGVTMSVKLVDAAFPAYQQVIPTSSTRSAKMSRAALLDALRAVSLVSSDRTSGVRMQFTSSKLTLSSENPDVGAGSDEIEIDLKGKDLTVGFNSRYLIDVLSALAHEDISIDLTGELDPGVIRPADSDNFVGVIMPMRI